MRKLVYCVSLGKWFIIGFVVFLVCPVKAFSQQLKITDFLLFGGNEVQLGSSSTLTGGSIGSYKLIRSTGGIAANGNLYSGEIIQLVNNNTVSGKITAAKGQSSNGTVLSVGSNAYLGGDIEALGHVLVSGGVVAGRVTHPIGTTYSGPIPANGDSIKDPTLPSLPQLPPITAYTFSGGRNISSNLSISPGEYGKLAMNGNKTVTFLEPGTYYFNAIQNTGTVNNFIFDFKNRLVGDFRLIVKGDVDLNKLNVTLMRGGDASRIYLEIHGNGSSSPDGQSAFILANGGSGSNNSRWMGSVFAPFGAISIGSGTGTSQIIGALWSGTKVNIQSGVTVQYNPYSFCVKPNVYAGADKIITCDAPTVKLDGSSATSSAQFNWSILNGKGTIVSGGNTASPTVSAAGTYILTVTSPDGCSATDTTVVTDIPCILPFYPPPVTGKVNNIIGSELNSLYLNFGSVVDSAKTIFILQSDSVMIEVIANPGQYQNLLSLLQTSNYGMTNLVNNGTNTQVITGKYPIAKLKKLDSLPSLISYCRPLFPAATNLGITATQGDTAMRTDFLRDGYGLNGDSVKVGVLSDSYNTIPGDPARTDVDNGDLPGTGNSAYPDTVEVLLEYPFGRRIDEGRAMLQIIHDIAPKAKLAFRTGFISSDNFAEGIRELRQRGCDVIVDDVTFITEPFFKDGVVARAVNEVTAAGATYLAAAGNFANKSYQAVFNPVAAPAGLIGHAHSFNNSGDIFQNISLKPGVYTIVLQWEDGTPSLGEAGAKNDLDIYLTDNSGATLFGFNRNNITGLGADPIEVLPFTVTANTQTNILIVRAAGTDNVNFKYLIFRGDAIINEYNSGTSTIVGQANSEGAITLGAVRYTKTPVYGVSVPELEIFSSIGGTPVQGALRSKPDFTAPDGINTSVNFSSLDLEGDKLPNFFGTSAAAPHAAAVVALLQQARKRYFGQHYTSAQIRDLLKNTALDMNVPGFDYASGFGFIRPEVAIQTFASATPSLIQLVVPTGITPGSLPFTVTVKGDYLSDNTQVLFRGDPITTTFVNDSTLTADIPSFTGNPSIQALTPCQTPGCNDGGLSNTITFYDPVKKSIKITADSKTKQYGEVLPSFTSTIRIDGVRLDSSGYSLLQLGIDKIYYRSPANSMSNVNNYIIQPSLRKFDVNDPVDAGLLELYNYDSIAGVLAITNYRS